MTPSLNADMRTAKDSAKSENSLSGESSLSSEPSLSEHAQTESVSANMSDLITNLRAWVSDLFAIFSTESRLALLSLNSLLVLSLILAQVIFLSFIMLVVVIGFLLSALLPLQLVELAALALVLSLAVIFILLRLMRSLYKNISLTSTFDQLKAGLAKQDDDQ